MTFLIPEPPVRALELIAVGDVEPSILRELRPELERRFDVEVRVGDPIPIDPDWFDEERKQYRAGPILDRITELSCATLGDPAYKSLGIIDADIYAPNISFIFGQAIVGGCCGIIGLARLRPEFYQKSPDHRLFARRTLIEAVHEIGHAAGLEHCPNETCVMNFSRTIQDSDRKGPDLCDRCQRFIRS